MAMEILVDPVQQEEDYWKEEEVEMHCTYIFSNLFFFFEFTLFYYSINRFIHGQMNFLLFFFWFRSPIVSAAGAIGSYLLPETISEMWDPARDFAFAKLPGGKTGAINVCALSK